MEMEKHMRSTDFVIEKGVPLPQKRRRPSRYPFADMNVGDSFVTSNKSVRGAMIAYAKRHPKKCLRFIAEAQETGNIRVWREE